MPGTLWTAPALPLLPGTSAAKNTFTTLAAMNGPGETNAAQSIIYGNTLNPGSYLTIQSWGVFSNTATPTLQIGAFYGAAGAVDLALSAAKTTTTGATNWVWEYRYLGRVTAVGTAGSIMGIAYWRLGTSATAFSDFIAPETAPAAVTIDTTVNKTVGMEAAWSASSTSNTITVHACLVLTHG